jgi:1-acyl-sn-glycerol-3-phosphate acyltransferase
MKTIYKILLIPWAAWCILVFIILCLILLPVLVIAVLSRSERLIYAAHFAPTRLARICLFLFGIRLEIRGREHIDPKGQYIFTSNHRSLLDAVLGYLLDKFYVPVERNNKEDRTQSMRLVEEKLKSGASFFICPEGTCNRTDEFFTHFYNGAFRMSADTGIPLMPLTFIGSGDRWPRSEPRIYPGRLIVYYHVPIPASAFQGDNLESGKQQVIELMRQDLLKHYPSGKY